MSDFSSTSYPRARKAHHCLECGRTIVVGERYARNVGANDGNFDQWDDCIDCDAWAAAFCDAGKRFNFVQDTTADLSPGQYEVGRLWDGIEEFYREVLGHRPEAGVAASQSIGDTK